MATVNIFDMADTWNAIGTTFNGIYMNFTDGAGGAPVGAAASRFLRLDNDGTRVFDVDASGNMVATAFVNPGQSTTAFDWSGTATARFMSFGVEYVRFAPGDPGLRIRNQLALCADVGGIDVLLASDAVNVFAQRNGTNAQEFRVYNTFTDASNYERFTIIWSGSLCALRTSGAGTGSQRGLYVDGADFNIQTGSNTRWQVGSAGHLVAATDNAYDIGQSGANRPRSIYSGTNVVVGNNLSFITSGKGIVGTATNDNADAGNVGQIIESEILVGSAVALTTATTANVTSISLTAGDWDVWGNVWYTPAATTSITIHQGAISQVSATLPTAPNKGAHYKVVSAALVPNAIFGRSVGLMRISLASTTTVYLVTQATFTIDTLSAYGYIGARRVR